ncbi:MAG: hypothetical protein EOM54_05650 [Clostridia bacterium]|nr:hypothetical protein [Clostridia bacterium]
MIYDRTLTIYSLSAAGSPLGRRLTDGTSYYYGELEIYTSRFLLWNQSGEKIHMMVELPRVEGEARIRAEMYCIPEDGQVYRIIEARYGYDSDGLPITTLSLQLTEGKYDILEP